MLQRNSSALFAPSGAKWATPAGKAHEAIDSSSHMNTPLRHAELAVASLSRLRASREQGLVETRSVAPSAVLHAAPQVRDHASVLDDIELRWCMS